MFRFLAISHQKEQSLLFYSTVTNNYEHHRCILDKMEQCNQFTTEQCEEIMRIAKEIDERYGAGTWSPGEHRPTNRASVLVTQDGEVRPELQTWGYKLPDSMVINARAETATEKPISSPS